MSGFNSARSTFTNRALQGDLTHREQFIELIEADPGSSEPWVLLGFTVGNDPLDTVTVQGKDYTKQECFIKALKYDPQNGSAWNNLAFTMGLPHKKSSTAGVNGDDDGQLVTVQVGSEQLTRKDCCARSLMCDPTNPTAWNNAGASLRSGEVMSLPGNIDGEIELLGPRECFLRALANDATDSAAWNNVAYTLKRDEVLEVGDVVSEHYGKKECYLLSLKFNPTNEIAMRNLIRLMTLEEGDEVIYEHEHPVEWFMEVLTEEPESVPAWAKLAEELGAGDGARTVEMGGDVLTGKDCAAQAIQIDPNDPRGWYAMGKVLSNDEFFVREDGAEPMSRNDCLTKAKECVVSKSASGEDESDEDAPRATEPLRASGPDTQPLSSPTAAASAPTISREAVPYSVTPSTPSPEGSENEPPTPTSYLNKLIKALEENPERARVWYEAGRAIPDSDTTITVNGTEYNKTDCYVQACERRPTSSYAWNNLGTSLPKNGTVIVSGLDYTQVECFAEACSNDPRNQEAWANLARRLPKSSSDPTEPLDENGTVLIRGSLVDEKTAVRVVESGGERLPFLYWMDMRDFQAHNLPVTSHAPKGDEEAVRAKSVPVGTLRLTIRSRQVHKLLLTSNCPDDDVDDSKAITAHRSLVCAALRTDLYDLLNTREPTQRTYSVSHLLLLDADCRNLLCEADIVSDGQQPKEQRHGEEEPLPSASWMESRLHLAPCTALTRTIETQTGLKDPHVVIERMESLGNESEGASCSVSVRTFVLDTGQLSSEEKAVSHEPLSYQMPRSPKYLQVLAWSTGGRIYVPDPTKDRAHVVLRPGPGLPKQYGAFHVATLKSDEWNELEVSMDGGSLVQLNARPTFGAQPGLSDEDEEQARAEAMEDAGRDMVIEDEAHRGVDGDGDESEDAKQQEAHGDYQEGSCSDEHRGEGGSPEEHDEAGHDTRDIAADDLHDDAHDDEASPKEHEDDGDDHDTRDIAADDLHDDEASPKEHEDDGDDHDTRDIAADDLHDDAHDDEASPKEHEDDGDDHDTRDIGDVYDDDDGQHKQVHADVQEPCSEHESNQGSPMEDSAPTPLDDSHEDDRDDHDTRDIAADDLHDDAHDDEASPKEHEDDGDDHDTRDIAADDLHDDGDVHSDDAHKPSSDLSSSMEHSDPTHLTDSSSLDADQCRNMDPHLLDSSSHTAGDSSVIEALSHTKPLDESPQRTREAVPHPADSSAHRPPPSTGRGAPRRNRTPHFFYLLALALKTGEQIAAPTPVRLTKQDCLVMALSKDPTYSPQVWEDLAHSIHQSGAGRLVTEQQWTEESCLIQAASLQQHYS